MNDGRAFDRRLVQFSMFNASGVGLEIGPGHNPLVPKREGFRVEVLDYANASYLRSKWRNVPSIDPSGIEEVDYVTGGGSILEAVPHRGHYDYVVASHVVEHMPDLLGFLRACEALLKPSGRLVLSIPDKRFCFDVLRPVSTIGQVLQASLEQRTRNIPGVVFDHAAYHAVLNGRGDWASGSTGSLVLQHGLVDAHHWFEAAQDPEYMDVHAWQFTPSSLRLIMMALSTLALTGLREAQFHPGQGCEFFIALSTEGTGCPISFDTLSRLSLMEEATALLAVVNGSS